MWCYVTSFLLVSLFHSLGKYFWLPLSSEVINWETIPIAYQLTPYSITFTHVHIYTDIFEAKFFASTIILLVLLYTTDLTVKLPQSSYIPKAALNYLNRLLKYSRTNFNDFFVIIDLKSCIFLSRRYYWIIPLYFIKKNKSPKSVINNQYPIHVFQLLKVEKSLQQTSCLRTNTRY